MAIVINGSGTVTGLAVGGLPDGTVDAGTLATDSVVTGKIADGTIANADIADLAASKLTGALPAISGASLTGLKAGTAAFSARRNASVWISVANGTILTFNDDSTGDSFDTDNVYNTSTYKFTAPATGVYMFWLDVYTAQNDAANGFAFLKNSARADLQYEGSDMFTYVETETGDNMQQATIVIPLASGDTMGVITAVASDWYTGHSQWGGCRLA